MAIPLNAGNFSGLAALAGKGWPNMNFGYVGVNPVNLPPLHIPSSRASASDSIGAGLGGLFEGLGKGIQQSKQRGLEQQRIDAIRDKLGSGGSDIDVSVPLSEEYNMDTPTMEEATSDQYLGADREQQILDAMKADIQARAELPFEELHKRGALAGTYIIKHKTAIFPEDEDKAKSELLDYGINNNILSKQEYETSKNLNGEGFFNIALNDYLKTTAAINLKTRRGDEDNTSKDKKSGKSSSIYQSDTEQESYAKQLAKEDAKRVAALEKSADESNKTLATIQNFKRASEKFPTGIASPIALKAGQIAAYTGIPGGKFGIPTKEQTEAGEALGSFGLNFVMGRTQNTKGAVSDREMDLYKEGSPDIMKLPGGNTKILNAMEAIELRNIEKSKFSREWAAKNYSLNGADKAWDNFTSENTILNRDWSINRNNITNWDPYLEKGYSKPKEENGSIEKEVSSSQSYSYKGKTVSEADIQATMKKYNMTKEEVLSKLEKR